MAASDIAAYILKLPISLSILIWALLKQSFSYKHIQSLEKSYLKFYKGFSTSNEVTFAARKSNYAKMTPLFYGLITDFYEFGWGRSFHFAPRYKCETFKEAMTRYEHFFAANFRLDLTSNEKQCILDVGCGVGGPMRTIAKFFKYRVSITGVNITHEHIKRALVYNEREDIKNCNFIECDFNTIPVQDSTFDAAYDMEATLHSTDLETTFKEIYRVLKPGKIFVSAQYCLKEAYRHSEHQDIIRMIDNLNGCYISGRTAQSTRESFQKVGFEILLDEDVFEKIAGSDYNFHESLEDANGVNFATSNIGMFITSSFCYIGETLKLLPTGTSAVQKLLSQSAELWKVAGRLKIVTPGHLFIVRKPLHNY